MLWRKKDKASSQGLKCQVAGCNFICNDYIVLQRHLYRKHPGLELHCQVAGCDFVCKDYMILEKHVSWKHPGEKAKPALIAR